MRERNVFRIPPCVCICAIVAISWAAPAAGVESQEAAEAFLKSARVVSIEEVGEGVTHSQRVELEKEGRRARAIFKTVDMRFKAETRFGSEVAQEFRDSYKFEIAAYELDKLLGLNIVPPVVERRIGGARGSLQMWAEGTMARFSHADVPPTGARMHNPVHVFWLFDYLIFNVDRHWRNVVLDADWHPIPIDHSMSFTTHRKPFRALYRFPAEPVQRLRSADRRAIKKALGRYLQRDQIDALMARREVVLRTVDRQLSEHLESDVLFPWPPSAE
jgi:hypothetical protein